jgi:glutathione S-transferase
MVTFYYSKISINARRVWIALLEKGIDFEPVLMKLDGDQYTPEFLAMNPFHHIPVLKDGDFSVIESLAILDYLEAQYPDHPLMPTEPRAIATVRMVNMVTVNEFAPSTFPLMMDAFGLFRGDDKQLEQSRQKIEVSLSFLEAKLAGTFFLGDVLTLADVVVGTAFPILSRINLSLEPYPKLNTWFEHISARESWQNTEPLEEEVAAFKTKLEAIFKPK